MLGDDALDAVQGLVDQSLLSVRETRAGLRYRMLETVREFGRMQLVDAGEDERRARGPPRAGRPRTRAATAHGLLGRRPVRGDRRARRRGDQPRRRAARRDRRRRRRRARRAARRARDVLDDPRRARPPARPDRRRRRRGRGWRPPPELEDVARAAMAIVLSNAMVDRRRAQPSRSGDCCERLGPGSAATRASPGWSRVLLAYDPARSGAFLPGRLERLAADPDRDVALPGPGSGSATCARTRATRSGRSQAAERALALAGDDDGPWNAAILRTQLAAADDAPRRHATRASTHARPPCR